MALFGCTATPVIWLQQLAGGIELVAGMPVVVRITGRRGRARPSQSLQRRIAGALANAVDGALDLARPCGDGGQ